MPCAIRGVVKAGRSVTLMDAVKESHVRQKHDKIRRDAIGLVRFA